jgi:hypothetical protein
MSDDWIYSGDPRAPKHPTVWRGWFEPQTEPAYYRASWGSSSIHIERFPIIRTTPKGVWVRTYVGERDRFICSSARKQFASPTEAEAIRQLLFRTKKRIAILAAQHDDAVKSLALFEKGMGFSNNLVVRRPNTPRVLDPSPVHKPITLDQIKW